jgi:hypothetical protein
MMSEFAEKLMIAKTPFNCFSDLSKPDKPGAPTPYRMPRMDHSIRWIFSEEEQSTEQRIHGDAPHATGDHLASEYYGAKGA